MYKIYIAEDDEGIAKATAKGLSGWEFDVKCAEDFRRIAYEIAEYQPHLVLMDVSALSMFRVGWNLSVGSVLLYVLLAIALVIVGAVFYHEKLTFKRLLGVVLCIMGIIMISDILPF